MPHLRRLLQASVRTIKPEVVTSSDLVLATESNIKYNASNTNTTGGYFMDGEDGEGGFTDMETVAVACVATLIPLCIILFFAFFVRSAWRKYNIGQSDGSPGGSTSALRRADSSEPTAAKSTVASTGHLLPDELKTSESAFSVTPVDETRLDAPQLPLLGTTTGAPKSGPPTSLSADGNHTSAKSANGSIITLTMQNNHLIVETEAVGDSEGPGDAMSADSLDLENTTTCTSQQAQIHEPPAEARTPSPPCFTGLAASLSSLGSPSYCYGTQVGYPASYLGYTQSMGYPVQAYKSPPHHKKSSCRLRMQLSMQDDSSFAPSHHRSASLPMRLARSQTIAEAPSSLAEVKEPSEKTEIASRGGGKFKARASLPCINPVTTSVLSKLSSDTPPPPSIAE